LPKLIFTEIQSKKLKKLGILNSFDLLLHLPHRYIDETKIDLIKNIRPGSMFQIEAKIISIETSYRPRKNLTVYVKDVSGGLKLRFINFYPSQIKQFEEGRIVRVYGEIRLNSFLFEMIHPQYEFVSVDTPLKNFYTPVYPATEGLSQKLIFKLVQKVLEQKNLEEQYPDYFGNLYRERNLPSLLKALKLIHKPKKEYEKKLFDEKKSIFHQRLIYDELLAHQFFFRGKYHENKSYKSKPILYSDNIQQEFLSNLEFKLTNQQESAFSEIKNDISQNYPMYRLLQGDVGSGKTVVAAMGAIQAINSDFQVAFLAPTEILAEQHFEKLTFWLAKLGIKVELLTGSMNSKLKAKSYEIIKNGKAKLIVGTHALIQEKVEFKFIGLYIIDEQHRFGVKQRLALRKKSLINKNFEPHQLMMSATPIPRTLAMNYFADMDISIINELPPGRQTITTKVFSNEKRNEILDTINQHCLNGNQVYWVCPLIEESETLQLETAEKTFEDLSNYFVSHKVGLIHGRLPSNDKKEIMEKFKINNLKILVATTVIEVGVDVPNATLMVIENAERMGLSQLHQLRGRIGRGDKKSICILLYQKKLSDIAKQRLRVIYENIDGFKIAEEDLKLRGPGELLGLRQSGLPSLRVADLERDQELLVVAKADADSLLETSPKDALMHIDRWHRNYQDIGRS
jgi:ATP-dependent DNA helicase RecG